VAFWDRARSPSVLLAICDGTGATACSASSSHRRVVAERHLKPAVPSLGLVRERRLTAEERVIAVRLLRQLRAAWDEIQPDEKVRSLAEELPMHTSFAPETPHSLLRP
jgi:hypothetical protein